MDLLVALNPLQQADSATVWAGVSALAAVVTTLVAIFSLNQIRKDSRDATRATATLVVSNVGRSVARNVVINFDPLLPEVSSAQEGLVHPINRRYADPIPTVTPGMRLDNVWRFRGDAVERRMAVPADRVVATATYEDTRGRTYEDRYVLATDVFESGTYPEPGGTDQAAMEKRTAKALEAIARALAR